MVYEHPPPNLGENTFFFFFLVNSDKFLGKVIEQNSDSK